MRSPLTLSPEGSEPRTLAKKIKKRLSKLSVTRVETLWYQPHFLRWFLYPASLCYQAVFYLKQYWVTRFYRQSFSVPVIVVGNITVGGVGKTPLVIALAKEFNAHGLRVGIVSRGYGARIKNFPHEVKTDESAASVGDEPLFLAQKTQCPTVIAPKRVQAVNYLIKTHAPHIIISDDGLQHAAMGRAIEIAVIDGQRKLGNGLCLPAGPLRERKSRLNKTDLQVVTEGTWHRAFPMTLKPIHFREIVSGHIIPLDAFDEPVAAVAGIGNPQRFFNTLTQLKIPFTPYVFPDHHLFTASEFLFEEKKIVMTEKDAVKCASFATASMYCLSVEPQLDKTFWDALWSLVSERV